MQSTMVDNDFEFDCPNSFYILPNGNSTFRSAEEQELIDQSWFTVSHELPDVVGSTGNAANSRRSSAGRVSTGGLKQNNKAVMKLDDVPDDVFAMFEKKYGNNVGNDKENITSSAGNSIRRISALSSNAVVRSLSSTKKRPSTAITASPAVSSSGNNTIRSNSVERRPIKVARPGSTQTGTIGMAARTKTPSRILPSAARVASASNEKRSVSCGSTNRRPLSTSSSSCATLLVPSSSVGGMAEVTAASAEDLSQSTETLTKHTVSGASTSKSRGSKSTTTGSAELKAKLAEVKSRVNSHQSTKKLATASNSAVSAEKSLELLLKQHNARFAPVPAYEPPRHSVRDVRRWEKLTGKTWNELKPEDREKVNEEISKMKVNGDLQ